MGRDMSNTKGYFLYFGCGCVSVVSTDLMFFLTNAVRGLRYNPLVTTLVVTFLYYDVIEKYNYLLWITLIFAMTSFNIHIVRFFIGFTRNNK